MKSIAQDVNPHKTVGLMCGLSLIALTMIQNTTFAGPPIGFERWTKSDHSSVVFDQTCEQLQASYNHPNFFGPYNPNNDVKKFYRLTDIEVRKDPHLNTAIIMDGVFVQNTDRFEKPSWLICGLTRQSLNHYAKSQSLIALDVERYELEGKEQWAAIFQINENGSEWEMIYEKTIDDMNISIEDEDLRVVDIDWHGWQPGGKECPTDSNLACFSKIPTFSAVAVKNLGADRVTTLLEMFKGDESGSASGQPTELPSGMLLVDRELIAPTNKLHNDWDDPSNWRTAMLFVDRPNEFETKENLTQGMVHAFNWAGGRVTDLEWYMRLYERNAGFFETWYHTVHANLL